MSRSRVAGLPTVALLRFPLRDEEAAAVNPTPAVEESCVAFRLAVGSFFAGGKRNCEIAITIRERKRARKKRLSIQGTGS